MCQLLHRLGAISQSAFLCALVVFVAPTLAGESDPRGGPNEGIVDIITGNLYVVQQQGRVGSKVGISIGTTACNKGTIPADWRVLPDNRHPVIAQNLYRLKNDRLEQLGHSWVKHGFGVIANDICGFGCTPGCDSTALCGGCADSYNAQLNGNQFRIGSRAWIQPFTGFFIGGSNQHAEHVHDGVSHRIIVDDADLDPDSNGNGAASYFVEGQYVHPQEFTDAASRAARAMMNNVTYRPIAVSGVAGGTYTLAFAGPAVVEQPAIRAWSGATLVELEPEPGIDGHALLAWKATPASLGQWRYEYALYNENLDRGLNALWIELGAGARVNAQGFYAPPNHPGWTNDGTAGDAGFSNASWSMTSAGDNVRWDAPDFASDPNANAVRWGTLYNFWFFSNEPPRPAAATVGYFKTADADVVTAAGPASRCDGDIDDDRDIDLQDLALVLSDFGPTCGAAGCPPSDINGDGVVDLQDLATLLGAFGGTCPD